MPRTTKRPREAEVQGGATAVAPRRRVLVVEDQPGARAAMAELLRRRGMEPWEAGTLAEAMVMLRHGPDWVVLDLSLPDGNGLTLLRRVRLLGPAVKVAVVSAATDPDLLARVKELAPEAYFAKPVDFSDLVERMDGGRPEDGRAEGAEGAENEG